jgi:hypothetical protein
MPASSSWRCQCGSILPARTASCPECGTVRPAATPGPPVRHCRFDGGELDALGFCARGNGFPWPMKCPFVCPHCRGPLSWNGGCDRCRGSDTPEDRETWTFTGDYYEPVGDQADPSYGHHVRRYKGPTPVPTRAEIAGYFQEFRDRLDAIAAKRAGEAAPDR